MDINAALQFERHLHHDLNYHPYTFPFNLNYDSDMAGAVKAARNKASWAAQAQARGELPASLDANVSQSTAKIVNKVLPRSGPIRAPAAFRKYYRNTKELRRDPMWADNDRGKQHEQMEMWFPDIHAPSPGLADPFVMEEEGGDAAADAMDVGTDTSHPTTAMDVDDNKTHPSTTPTSDIGILRKLPGELRNRIYRLALLNSADVAELTTVPMACAVGACIHKSARNCVPGLANTCRQIRSEALSIYLAENAVFRFDAGMVRNSCVANYLRTLGDSYAAEIREFGLQLKRPIWVGDQWAADSVYDFVIKSPAVTGTGLWALEQKANASGVICHCILLRLLKRVNEEDGFGIKELVTDESFEDYLWRCHKTKQPVAHLATCRECKNVVFRA